MGTQEHLTDDDLRDVQAFVTSGLGRWPCSGYLFFEIRESEAGRVWVEDLLPDVARAGDWPFSQLRRERDLPALLNFAFTSSGLRALGLPESALQSFPVEFLEGAGSAQRSWVLGDAGVDAPEHWEIGGSRCPPLHAFVLLHAESQEQMAESCVLLRKRWKRFSAGVIEHTDRAQFGGILDGHKEHFGFRDGIAQPRIAGLSKETPAMEVRAGEFILGHRNEYGFYPPVPVVEAPDDPDQILPRSLNPHHAAHGYRDLGRNGSFLVYRKLEQDVAAFWAFMRSESVRLRGVADGSFMVWLASRMVGRWPNGTPLVLSPDRDRLPPDPDAFGYAGDPLGLACPVGAHIRRTHPRDHLRPAETAESLRMSARRRLLRRGRPYGLPLFPLEALDDAEDAERLRAVVDCEPDGRSRGVHFLCINASIKGQFESVQQAWVNNPRFNGLVDNPDPLMGQRDLGAGRLGAHDIPGCPSGIRTSVLPRFVTVRGGVYAFMPSLTALRYLARG